MPARDPNELSRIVREREEAASRNADKARQSAEEQYASAREKALAAVLDAAAEAYDAIRQMSEDDWPPHETLAVRQEVKRLFGGYRTVTQEIAAFEIATYRYIGGEQTWATPEYMRYKAPVYLLADGRLSIGDRPLDAETRDRIVTACRTPRGGWGDETDARTIFAAIDLENLRGRLLRIASQRGV